jgi:hypothetical protein
VVSSTRAIEVTLLNNRPVLRAEPTTFALPSKVRSSDEVQDFALTAGDQPVAVGRFRSPCPRRALGGASRSEIPSEDCAARR